MKHGNLRLMAVSSALISCLVTSPLVLAEVYRWTDENGVTHFSQTPPPGGQQAEIEDVPDSAAAENSETAAGIDFDGSGAGGAEATAAAELRRRQLSQAADQRRAEREALAALCEEALSRLAQIEPSRRVYYTDDAGETVRLDDEQRVAEVERLNDFLTKNCP